MAAGSLAISPRPAKSAMSTSGLPSVPCSHVAPRSTGTPAASTVQARPPTRSRASSTVTSTPSARSARAAPSPAAPAPSTSTRSGGSGRGASTYARSLSCSGMAQRATQPAQEVATLHAAYCRIWSGRPTAAAYRSRVRRRSTSWSTTGSGRSGAQRAHVGAVGIEALRLQVGVEDAEVRRGVETRARHPLPVAGVRREVAVGQVLAVEALPAAPVHVQVLDQEARADHAHAVRLPPGLDELPHPGVDEPVARLAAAPGLEVRVRSRPLEALVARVDAALGEVGVVVQHVLEPVAPEQLGAPLAGPGSARHREAAARREHAELEVRREARRGAVVGDVVALRRVLRQAAVAPAAQACQPGRLAATQVGRSTGEAEVGGIRHLCGTRPARAAGPRARGAPATAGGAPGRGRRRARRTSRCGTGCRRGWRRRRAGPRSGRRAGRARRRPRGGAAPHVHHGRGRTARRRRTRARGRRRARRRAGPPPPPRRRGAGGSPPPRSRNRPSRSRRPSRANCTRGAARSSPP